MSESDTNTFPEIDLDKPIEEHIEMESMTGRFRRDAVKAAQNRAEAKALANNRRNMRIPAGSFVASYILGDDPDKFSLFGSKKCKVVDASISGLGIEAKKGLHKGDKLVVTISDGKNGDVPKFEIIVTVMYAGDRGNKLVCYGLQYDERPPSSYSGFITKETLKIKMAKAREKAKQRQSLEEV